MSHLITSGRYAGLIAKSNNITLTVGGVLGVGPGIVNAQGAAAPALPDLVHLVALGRSFYVTKIMWYNPGVLATLIFGTLSNAAVPVLVPMFPIQVALPGLAGELLEEELVGVEFMLNSQAAPLGWDGSLHVRSTVAGVEITCEVAEKA